MTWKLSGPSQIITGDETLTILRQGIDIPDNVVYVDGKPVRRNPETFKIICNVQPLNGRDLLLVPEADRYKEQWWVYMNNEEKPLHDNDIAQRVEEDDLTGSVKNYQVQSVEAWGSFTRARIMRIDVGSNATP
jgi:hypothetical protein